ncbi:MAG TPA: hypothetical protein VJR02_25850 [Pyrinomonadaceae bacterium]|nr:hypothetical protein [Pyrinomonadaceae bacterium]
MYIRTLLLSMLVLLCGSAAMAQQPGPQFWRKVGCEPFEPRTRLETLNDRYNAVIIKGFTRITTVEVRGVRIDAVEMRDLWKSSDNRGVLFAKGLVVVLREGGERPGDNRAFVDFEEIDPLLNAIDAISQVDETATKLVGFEGKYKTMGDLEISVFRQTRSGTAVIISTGICDRPQVTLTLDDLAKIKAQIQEAKARLDEIR